jgi:hypothetical protein
MVGYYMQQYEYGNAKDSGPGAIRRPHALATGNPAEAQCLGRCGDLGEI